MSNPVKIVMVEDDHGHAKLIEKNIRRANISNEIVHFDHGQPALDYLFSEEVKANGPMLILLDLNLPDMSGTDILAEVKRDERLRRALRARRKLKVSLRATFKPAGAGVPATVTSRCNVYITKPVDYESFAGAIRQLGLFLSVMQAPEIE